MSEAESTTNKGTPIGSFAARAVLQVEVLTYVILGFLLAATALLGIGNAGMTLWKAAQDGGQANSLVLSIDRLLFVLMVVEILHTVRVSFAAGALQCEPFLVVGLIASIRRVLVITLESSEANLPGKWSPELKAFLMSMNIELTVLGVLILVMVVSIYILRRSERLSR